MSDQNQTLPRRSRRLATIIPASHWMSIGYSPEAAQAMESLQNDLKKYYEGAISKNSISIDELFPNLFGEEYSNLRTIELVPRDNNGDDLIDISHHEWMLPHWIKFAKGFGDGLINVQNILIGRVSMPLPVLDILLPAFQTAALTQLNLFQIDLGNDGYLRLSTFLRENSSLKCLIFGMEEIHDVTVASSFSGAIMNHPNLEILLFIECGIGNNISILPRILEGCNRLRIIAICSDGMKSECAAIMSDYIASNPRTEMISLDDNDISDRDTVLFASALMANTRLKGLSLKENNITEEGNKHLMKALFDTTSMDSIANGSNHSCVPLSINDSSMREMDIEVLHINDNDEATIEQKIRMKVVLALCGLDGSLFDLSHFNDIPLQLMPRVLELIQQHSAGRKNTWNAMQLEQDTLSRLYHTLRGWEMPSLFVNLRCSPAKAATRKRRRNGRR